MAGDWPERAAGGRDVRAQFGRGEISRPGLTAAVGRPPTNSGKDEGLLRRRIAGARTGLPPQRIPSTARRGKAAPRAPFVPRAPPAGIALWGVFQGHLGCLRAPQRGAQKIWLIFFCAARPRSPEGPFVCRRLSSASLRPALRPRLLERMPLAGLSGGEAQRRVRSPAARPFLGLPRLLRC